MSNSSTISKKTIRPDVAIIKYPSTLGGSNSPLGLAEAPDHLLLYGLQKRLEEMGFDVLDPITIECLKPSNEKKDEVFNLDQLIEVSQKAASIIEHERREGRFVLTIGGRRLKLVFLASKLIVCRPCRSSAMYIVASFSERPISRRS